MVGGSREDASIQAFFTPSPSPVKLASHPPASNNPPGDGFTAEEVSEALRPPPSQQWCPSVEYAEYDVRDLQPGPRALTFMGRVANIFDVTNTPKTPRSAKGCVKLCVKDSTGAVTVSSSTYMRVCTHLLRSPGSCMVCTQTAEYSSRDSGLYLDYSR